MAFGDILTMDSYGKDSRKGVGGVSSFYPAGWVLVVVRVMSVDMKSVGRVFREFLNVNCFSEIDDGSGGLGTFSTAPAATPSQNDPGYREESKVG